MWNTVFVLAAFSIVVEANKTRVIECACGIHHEIDTNYKGVEQVRPIETTLRCNNKKISSHYSIDYPIGNNLTSCQTDGYCHKSVTRENGVFYSYYSCLDREKLTPPQRPFYCHHSENLKEKNQIQCCNNGDLCNLYLNFSFSDDPLQEKTLPLLYTIILVVVLIILFIFILIVFWIKQKAYFRKREELPKFIALKTPLASVYQPSENSPLFSDETQNTTIRAMIDNTCSGSGSGLPLLAQRSIARQVILEELIGQGRFGQVWRGNWHGEPIAVKIFSTRDEHSWYREAEIFQTVMLRHDNILGFIGTDNKDIGTWTQLWLLTDYHEYGSLYDYLSKHLVTPNQMFHMALSMITGLAHLHLDIIGMRGKPGIAHCDLKSKNILVKKNLTCAIADLGLCVRHDVETNKIDRPVNNKTGTKRYLAPEVLDESINVDSFDSWKRADIYSLSLVLWELGRRTNVGGIFEDYQLPFFEYVETDPSFEQMRNVVCDKNIRPSCPNRWNDSPHLRALSNIIKESWLENSSARLTVIRIKKNLAKFQINTNSDKQMIV